jgi:hypothetical protein
MKENQTRRVVSLTEKILSSLNQSRSTDSLPAKAAI